MFSGTCQLEMGGIGCIDNLHLFNHHPVYEYVLRHMLTGNGRYRLYR